jgi:hypothetical protein
MIVKQASTGKANWSTVFLLAGLIWVAYWMFYSRSYWEDDAYIHLDYARNVFALNGFAFHGVPSNGDTSPVWVLLLSLSKVSGLDWIVAGKSLAAAGVVFFMAAAYEFSQRLAQDLKTRSEGFIAAGIFVLVLNPFFCFWAFSGMEAVTAAAWLMTMSVWLVPSRRTWAGFLLACCMTGIAPLLRPEMALLAVISVFFLFTQWRDLMRSTAANKAWSLTAISALLLMAPVAGWVIYSFAEFGYALPNTNAAKRASPDTWVLGRMLRVYLLGFPTVLLGLLMLPLGWRMGAAAKARALSGHVVRIPTVAWPVLAWFAATILFYVVNRTFVQTRYVLVVAPAVLLILFHLMRATWGGKPAVAFVALTGVIAAVTSLLLVQSVVRNKCIQDQRMTALMNYITEHVDARDPIAVNSIGLMAFTLENPIVDVGGITQPDAVKYLFGPKADMVRWAKAKGARYYVMADKPEPNAQLMFEIDAPTGGWSFNAKERSKPEPLRLWKLSPTS